MVSQSIGFMLHCFLAKKYRGPKYFLKLPVLKWCLLLFTHAPLWITSSCCISVALEHIFKHQFYMSSNTFPLQSFSLIILFVSYFSRWVSIRFFFLILYLQRVFFFCASNLEFSKLIFREIASKTPDFLLRMSGSALS